jgi:hypothetical protein
MDHSPSVRPSSRRVRYPIALLCVNDQIHQEAISLLYLRNECRVSLTDTNIKHDLKLLWNVLKITKLYVRVCFVNTMWDQGHQWDQALRQMNWVALRQMSSLRSLRLVMHTRYELIARHIAADLEKHPKGTFELRQMMRDLIASIPKSVTAINFDEDSNHGNHEGGDDRDGDGVFIHIENLDRECTRTLLGKHILRIYEEFKVLRGADIDL